MGLLCEQQRSRLTLETFLPVFPAERGINTQQLRVSREERAEMRKDIECKEPMFYPQVAEILSKARISFPGP